jgi:hypothetical protein
LSFDEGVLSERISIYCTHSKYPENPIVEFGKKQNNPFLMQYGDEVFKVYFDNDLIGINALHKYNWWQDLKYSFYFEMNGESLIYDFSVVPSDSVNMK